MKKILFISNGFAEDLVAITLIKELRKIYSEVEISCLPIVGNTKHFKDLDVNIIGPHWKLPSEGLNYGDWLLHLLDFLWGLPVLITGQIFSLFINRNKFDLTITLGDYVGIAAAAIAKVSSPLIHIWVCPARYYPQYVRKHIKKHGVSIYQRGPGPSSLDDTGIEVKCVGNPLFDTFEITGEDFNLHKNIPTIGVLPGSRKVAYKNLRLLTKVLDSMLQKRKVNFLIALSPKLEKGKFIKTMKQYSTLSNEFIITDKFGDVLNTSDLIIGLARTANEQALALGKPVVTFWGKGFSMSEKMVRKHAHRIMKKNALLFPPDPEKIVSGVLSLLDDPKKMEEMGKKGMEIMGPRGGSRVIAQDIKDFLERR